MGCCVPNELSQELTLEEIKEYNKLISDINQILTDKNNIDIYNTDCLLKLINRISVKISNCKEIIRKIKLKRFSSKFSGETLQNLRDNINQLNKYSKYLNEKITENRKESLEKENMIITENRKESFEKENMIINELGTKTVFTVNESQLRTYNGKSLDNFIYHKKCIRRSTKINTS